MALGENIKKFRKEKGLTQMEVAKKIEKSCSTFQKYELNLTKPPIEVIKEIANVLDISMVDLIYDINDPESDIFDAIDQEIKANNIALEKKISIAYNKLNKIGREKTGEYILDLSEIPKYTKPDNED